MAILIIAGIAVTLGTAKLKLSLTSSHKNHFLYSPRVLTFPHGHTPRAVAHRIYFVAQTGTQGRPVHAHRAIVRRRGKSGHRARPHVFRAAEPFSLCRRASDDRALQGSRRPARPDGRGARGFVEAHAPLPRRAHR